MKAQHLFLAMILAIGQVMGVLSPTLLAKAIDRQTNNTQCDDMQFIFARGSGESLQDVNETAWRTAIDQNLKNTTMRYSFYELGSTSQSGFQYPAVAVGDSLGGFMNMVGAVLSGGSALSFGRSVVEGSSELQLYLKFTSKACPNTSFVLGGYSQGAMVISRSLDKLDASRITYVATFGDPKLYLPEGEGWFPPACKGQAYSNYRAYVPDCHAFEGVLGSYRPYQPEAYERRMGAWCNTNDIMCSSGMSIEDHTAYHLDGLYRQAAAKITSTIKAYRPRFFVSQPQTTINGHDVAFVFDSTGSMKSVISKYRDEAKSLAKKVLSGNGRIALYDYRDLFEGYNAVQRCDFECDLTTFSAQLDNLELADGGDDNESALSALVHTMNTLNWQQGATKTIVLITDAGYHKVDQDGTTLADVANLSLSIDPVNVFVMTTNNNLRTYSELAAATNGKVVKVSSASEVAAASDAILKRPEAVLPLAEYNGPVETEFTFDASASTSYDGSALTFEWDLDGDNIFESSSDASPIIKKVYDTEFVGYIGVRVTDENGFSSTMSAKLTVSNAPPSTLPSISELTYTHNQDKTVDIDFTTNADKLLVILGDAPIGILDAKTLSHLHLQEVATGLNVTLVPYSASGERGDSKSFTIDFGDGGTIEDLFGKDLDPSDLDSWIDSKLPPVTSPNPPSNNSSHNPSLPSTTENVQPQDREKPVVIPKAPNAGITPYKD